MDIQGKFVDIDMDVDEKFHIHGKPESSHSVFICQLFPHSITISTAIK